MELEGAWGLHLLCGTRVMVMVRQTARHSPAFFWTRFVVFELGSAVLLYVMLSVCIWSSQIRCPWMMCEVAALGLAGRLPEMDEKRYMMW